MKAKTIDLEFLGQRMALKSKGDPEVADQVVDLVNARLKDAEKRARGLPAHKVALLALLELAEEMVQAKNRATVYQGEVRQKAENIKKFIETLSSPCA